MVQVEPNEVSKIQDGKIHTSKIRTDWNIKHLSNICAKLIELHKKEMTGIH